MYGMFLAVLHVAFETSTGLARKAAWEADGLSVFHIMPTQAAHTAAREFPPEVVVVELGDRAGIVLQAVRNVLGVPRRRGDQWPLVLAEVQPDVAQIALQEAPHAVLTPVGAPPEEVLAACLQAIEGNHGRWAVAGPIESAVR